MRTLFIIPLVLMSLVSFPSWSETIEDLVVREGVWYKKFSDIPFTGVIDGRISGKFLNGKFNGLFTHYWENGQLQTKGVYLNGKKEGRWVYFLSDGTALRALTGTFENGVKVSD